MADFAVMAREGAPEETVARATKNNKNIIDTVQ